MLCLAVAGFVYPAAAESVDCTLTLSAVLDDHYESTSAYQLEVSSGEGETRRVYFTGRPPLPHGRPFGKIFENWATWTIPLAGLPLNEGAVQIVLMHNESPRGDWIAFDRLGFECGASFVEERELGGYSNYGRDGAATILYGGGRLEWSFQARPSGSSAPLAIRFLDASGTVFPDAATIPYGAVFAIEARYESPQEEAQTRLTLSVADTLMELDLTRVGDGATYRSGPLMLAPPDD